MLEVLNEGCLGTEVAVQDSLIEREGTLTRFENEIPNVVKAIRTRSSQFERPVHCREKRSKRHRAGGLG